MNAKDFENLRRDWITELIDIKLLKSEKQHHNCVLCGGVPSLQETKVYWGPGDHKWSCRRFYLRNVVCTKCGLQTRRVLCKIEDDDSDTIFTDDRHVRESEVWLDWDLMR